MGTGRDERAHDRRRPRWRRRVGAAAVGLLIPVALPAVSASAATPCTPDGFWATCTQFDYTGADQVYTVPAGVSFIQVKVWGAAGAPGADPSSGAGFSTGTVPVSPGQQLAVTVGQGGIRNSTAPTFGGGGAGGSGERDASPGVPSWTIGGSGGGLSAVWTEDRALPLLIAGGSGAGAPTRGGVPGGNGGGENGGTTPDGSGASGGGGSAVAGGAAGDNGLCTTPAGAGTTFTGGAGSGGFDGGSGGGGGFYGGGGGSCQRDEGDDNNEGAGGGGSGYANTALVPGGTTTAATGTAAAGSDDVHYVAGIGTSGAADVGGNGMVVIQAEAPAPTPVPVTSTGAPGETQQVTVAPPAGGSTFLRTSPTLFGTTLTTAAGTYTVVPSTGVITYTPAPGFVGTAPPVTYVLLDVTDRTGESTYTVTVALPAAPAPADASTTGEVGATQTLAVPVPPGGQLRLLDAAGNPATRVVVAGEGTYTLGADGASVVFSPAARFAGNAVGVRFAVTDQYGQTGTARYAPVVTPPAPPVAATLTSTGPAGASQSVVLAIPDGGAVTLLNAQGEAVTTVVIAGQGTYTLDPVTGTLTFTPAAGFTGTADAVTYVVTDGFGQSSTGTYAATVTDAVTADPGGTGSGVTRLSDTGTDAAGPAAMAAMWLAGGAGLLLLRRRLHS
jgi:CshA-type fibril repeat protein